MRDGQLRPRRGAVAVQPARGKRSRSRRTAALELFGEVFNLFNAKQPGVQLRRGVVARPLFTGTLANHADNTVFMKPNAYAGDNGQPEQRVGQIGFRFVF